MTEKSILIADVTDETILNLCYDSNNRIKPVICKWLDTQESFVLIKKYLKTRYNDIPEESFSYKEVLFRIKSGIEIRPVCKICGAPVKFIGKTVGGAYPNYYRMTCCKEHERRLAKINEEETLQRKYGVPCTFKIPKIKEHGALARQAETAKRKKTETMLNKYGYAHAFQSPEARKAAKESSKKYRKEHPGYMTAVLKRRADGYAMMAKLLRDNPDKTIDNFKGIPEYEDCVSAYEKTVETVKKIFATQKKRGTLNTSAPENILYSILAEEFEDVERNYSDERYKYKCDFYIPSLDLFIEYQGSMFHNKKPYTEECKEELKRIQNKNAALKKNAGGRITRYDNLISTWTIRDVEKRTMAKKNNLNYLEVYPSYPLDDIVNCIRRNYNNAASGLQLIVGDDSPRS